MVESSDFSGVPAVAHSNKVIVSNSFSHLLFHVSAFHIYEEPG